MDPTAALLHGIVIPAAITLVCVLASWRPWKRAGVPTGAWGSALGIGIGYAAADFLIRGWHGLIPPGGSYFHPHIAVVTALIVAGLTLRRAIGARLPTSILLTAATACLILRAPLSTDWRGVWPFAGAAAAVGIVLWMCLHAAARKPQGARLPLMLWAAAAGAALILLQSHNAALAQMSGALAASMGVFVLLGWVRPRIPAVAGAIPVYVQVMLGLLIAGRGFAGPWKQTDWAIVMAAAAVASPVLTRTPPLRALQPWVGTLVGVLLTLAISAAGLYLTHDGFDFSGFR